MRFVLHFVIKRINMNRATVHFVNYDAPVSKMPLDITCIFVYMIQGHIKGEIMDLEFENYKNV